jgi:F0F1-type ATP synthase assembly protein I
VVRRSYKTRFRLLAVAIAGALAGIMVGYLLLSVTILRWSEQ